jgi:hypothetical protein
VGQGVKIFPVHKPDIMQKKVSGAADYIIPLGVVGLAIWGLNKLGIFGGGGTGLDPGSTPKPLAVLFNGPSGAQASNMQANLSRNITAQTWLNNYASTRGQDCFTSALYKANPGAVLIGPGDAIALYHLVKSQSGYWFSTGDFTGILAAFQNVVDNQTDMSYVATFFEANVGDMFNYITQSSTFANGENEAGNNMQLVAQFVQWAIGLPVTGQEQ